MMQEFSKSTMVIKVYGSPMSTCTQRVITTLKEKNVSFQLVPVDLMNGEQKKPEFLKKQPFGVIPVLEDDDYQIYESRGICRYLEQKYKGQGTALAPDVTDVKAFGKFEQAASVEIYNYDTCASGIVFEKLFKKMKGLGEADEAKVKQLTEKLEQTLDVYEQILSKQKYLAGNDFTLVD
ncbi:unnamed protein product [Didymodactylos carnosus]|uniref:glutathione transferase n=1 Tax=Didymodactylos carnosus TaxID=1234261 RepID=A0A8S2FRF6_9BILA|nr:unnamed protein product [Didymodactylos carnosus]CAF4326887.1 unnamed protein product [Didymodactylos carnosus]